MFALNTIFFILFNQFCICFYLYYILLILINKFGKHKRINVLFYDIKHLDQYLFFNFYK